MKQDDLQSIRSFAERYTAAWCGQNAERVAACYEENGSLKVNEGAPAGGREAITQVAQGFMTDFPDLQIFLNKVVTKEEGTIYLGP